MQGRLTSTTRRERKLHSGRACRLRKKLKRENERQLAALESFLANEDRAEADFQCVKALLLVVEGEGDDPHACVALVPCPARRARPRQARGDATPSEGDTSTDFAPSPPNWHPRAARKIRRAVRVEDTARLKRIVSPTCGRSSTRCIDERSRAARGGVAETLSVRGGGKTLLGNRRCFRVSPVTPADISRSSRPCARAISPAGPFALGASISHEREEFASAHARHRRRPAARRDSPSCPRRPFEDETRVFARPDAIALNQAEMSDDEAGDTARRVGTIGAHRRDCFRRRSRPSLGRKPGIRTTTRQRNPSNGRAKGGARSATRVARTPGDTRGRSRRPRRSRGRFWRSPCGRAGGGDGTRGEGFRAWIFAGALVRRRAVLAGADVDAAAGRSAGWAMHPSWELKAARKLPGECVAGQDLDMIVFGRDERLEWARKTGMFLARARTGVGDRRLHRDAWGGSVLDSVMGAMLTRA